MEYSELISEASNQKHAPDSSYFAYNIANFLYVRLLTSKGERRIGWTLQSCHL